MKKKITTIAIILILIAGSWLYFQQKVKKNKLTWRVMPAVTRTVTESITASGTINPVTQVNVGTEVSGKIDKIYKDFNDRVRKGELLAKLDTQTLQMNLEDSRIELRKAMLTQNDNHIDLQRALELFDENMISQSELQRYQYSSDLSNENVEKARFSVQRAETNLNNAMIYSPIDGVIISRAVDEGQTVAASLNAPTLFIIANNLDDMQIEVQIDEADIGKVEMGQRARFTVDAFRDMVFHGTVNQIRLSPIVESNVVTYKVIVSLTNPGQVIMPGMTANVEIIINQRQNVLAIQERALMFRPSKEVWESFKLEWTEELMAMNRPRTRAMGMPAGGGGPQAAGQPLAPPTSAPGQAATPGGEPVLIRQERGSAPAATATQKVNVWVLEEGKPKLVNIETGISDGSFIQVISGLSEGQEVITGVNQPNSQQSSSSAFGGAPGGMRVIRM
ncbi:MAG: efflux RND transporter periplasmic adaptor subunit [Candidatus Cloacimonetes bacterium]|nr:efflux RND transporter periplasmic adaptor subunit [Candidatus Cloacimonadota bacterium]